MKEKTVLVFGATGHLGAHIAIFLKNLGYTVIAIGRRKDNGFFHSHGILYTILDICNKEDFKKLPPNGVYAICHFAGALPASMRGYHPDLYISSIIQGTLNILEYSRAAQIDRIIFPQSLFDISYLFGSKTPIPADSPRKAPLEGDHAVYVIAKNAAVDLIEHYHAAYGIRRFILRLSRVYMYDPNPYTFTDGNKTLISDRYFIYRAIQGKDIEIWGDPSRLLETCSINDFLQIVGCSLSADVNGGIYNIGSGGSTLEERIRGIVEVFCDKDHVSRITYAPQKKSAQQFVLDIEKTKKELGYSPKETWKDYLLYFKREMREQPFAKLWGYEKDFIQDISII